MTREKISVKEEQEGEAFFDLESAQLREASRRLSLLGDLANTTYNYAQLRNWSHQVLVPYKVLWTWWQAHHRNGLEGLRPKDWEAIDEPTQEKVRLRYRLLSPLVDSIIVTQEQVQGLAQRNSWSERTALRWVQRYRVGGLWGLIPGNDPEHRSHPAKFSLTIRAPHTLDATAFDEIERRLFLVGEELLAHKTLSRKAVEARAKEVSVSERTIWHYGTITRSIATMVL